MGTKRKRVKLCGEPQHDWVRISKCKDALGKHPCKFYPDACENCKDRFDCYTRQERYQPKITAIFYRCKKCPAVKIEGKLWEFVEKSLMEIIDIREKTFYGLDSNTAQGLRNTWEGTQ